MTRRVHQPALRCSSGNASGGRGGGPFVFFVVVNPRRARRRGREAARDILWIGAKPQPLPEGGGGGASGGRADLAARQTCLYVARQWWVRRTALTESARRSSLCCASGIPNAVNVCLLDLRCVQICPTMMVRDGKAEFAFFNGNELGWREHWCLSALAVQSQWPGVSVVVEPMPLAR